MEEYKESVKWTISVGVNEGYELESQITIPLEEFTFRFQKIADCVEGKTGVYYSAVINMSRTVYKKEWGCPEMGEYTYTLSGCCNPAFCDVKKYKESLKELAKELRKEFGQTTVLLEVTKAEVYYNREGE